MKYTQELNLIWENYLSPKEGGLPLKADPALGMPYGGSPAVDENCEDLEQMNSEPTGEAKEIHMALADLQAITKLSHQLMHQLRTAHSIPGWVQAKITIANNNITDVAQYMDYETSKNSDCGCSDDNSMHIKAIRVVSI